MRYLFLTFLVLAAALAQAQTNVIDTYVQEGLQNNLTLKQQGFVLQRSLLALQEAKTLFGPTVNFNTTYSTAQGGRTISIPVGDLMNPVYSTLNVLTQSKAFPQIDNVNEQLVPKNFYDARFKTSMPLLNAEIKYNYAIKREQVNLQETEVAVFKRELVKDIKMAYFNYLKATEALNVYNNGLTLLKENERVNQGLVSNGMANPTVLIRVRNEISKIESEKQAAHNNQLNAQAYFNFLLNHDLVSRIQIDSTLNYLNVSALNGSLMMGNREELDKLQTAIHINENLLKMSQSYRQPKIGTIVDVGAQGKISNISSRNAFILFGLSLDLPVYTGKRNQLKVKEAETDILVLNTQLEQVKSQLNLQNVVAENSLNAAREIYESKQTQVETAQRYYRDIFRRYKEGQSNFIELLDAQTQITTAQLQQSIARYDVWLRWAELERAKAAYPLK